MTRTYGLLRHGLLRHCLLAAFLAVLAAGGTAAERLPNVVPADRGALAESADGVVTAPETPGFADYSRDLGGAVLAWISLLLERVSPGLEALVLEIGSVGAGVIFAVGLALFALLLFRLLFDYFASRPPPGPPPVTPAAGDRGGDRPGGDWTGELRRRLVAGDVAAACEALWWWLARRLAGDAAESSWTSRELLARTGRRDLAVPVRRLDRMIYGAAAPAVDDVRRLWHELEEAVE